MSRPGIFKSLRLLLGAPTVAASPWRLCGADREFRLGTQVCEGKESSGNAFGAIKAIAAAFPRFARRQPPPRLVRQRDQHRQTGADMQSKYKEASLRRLAVNFVEC